MNGRAERALSSLRGIIYNWWAMLQGGGLRGCEHMIHETGNIKREKTTTLREIPVRDDDIRIQRKITFISTIKRNLLITIKQVITSVQIRYNMFYERANKLYDC